MANNRVRTGSIYYYVPVLLDRCNPPIAVGLGSLKEGDLVRVVKLPGCPPPNTMGHAHFECLIGKTSAGFGGLCHVNSLLTKAQYVEYLRLKIAEIERNRG